MSDTNIEDEMEEESEFDLCKRMECLKMNQMPFKFSPAQSETCVEVPQNKYGVWYKQLCELQDLGLDKVALATSSKDIRRIYRTKFRNLTNKNQINTCLGNTYTKIGTTPTIKTPKIENKNLDPNFKECDCLEEAPPSPIFNSPRSSKSSILQTSSSSFVDCNCPQSSP